MKVTAAQKEKMEKDHDKIKEYYKVVKSGKSVRSRVATARRKEIG